MLPPDSHWAILAEDRLRVGRDGARTSKLRSSGPAVRPSAAASPGPARPVTFRPWRAGSASRARLVFGPKTPSALMPSAFWICFVVGFFAGAVVWPSRRRLGSARAGLGRRGARRAKREDATSASAA